MKTIKYFACIVLFSIQSLFAQNFWQQTNGPYNSATVNDFLLYSDSIIFLATNEGIIKSSDSGQNWNRIPSATMIISCLATDAFGTLFAGARDNTQNYFLQKSTDGGNTWFAMNTGLDADIRSILIPFKDTIIVGSWNLGIYRTFNSGTTWTQVNSGLAFTSVYKLSLLSNGHILVGLSNGGVWRTTSWGDYWEDSNSGIPGSGNQRYVKSIYEISTNQIFAGTNFGIYYSNDNGYHWSFKSEGCSLKVARSINKDLTGTLYAGMESGSGVYYSTNSGNYWYQLGLGFTTYTIGWDSDSRLYAGGSGLYRFAIEDSTWLQVYNQGYTPVEVNDLCLTKSGNLFACTEWWGLQYTSNNGELWTRTNYEGYEPYAIESINDSIIIIGTPDDYVIVSNDTGKTWNITGNFTAISLYYEPSTQIIYMGTSRYYSIGICGVYVSNDYGQNWSLLYEFPNAGFIQSAFELYVTKTNQVILVSQGNAWPPYSKVYYLYQSTDHGQNWEVIYEDQNARVTSIVEDVSSNLFALANDKLLVSEDEGKSWITRNIPGSQVLASDHSGKVFFDLRYSTDHGSTWFAMPGSGFEGAFNDALEINQNNRIFAASTQGVFYGEADSLVVSVENIKPVKTFSLSQNYPNPFNPSTVISYQLPVTSNVTLKVYDVLGNEIATLVNEAKQPGIYEVEFNIHSDEGRNLSSGIYFYQLKVVDPETSLPTGQAGSGQAFIETRKMVLIK